MNSKQIELLKLIRSLTVDEVGEVLISVGFAVNRETGEIIYLDNVDVPYKKTRKVKGNVTGSSKFKYKE